MNVVLNASSENLNRMHVFPTPESPISNNLNNKSYDFFAISFNSLLGTGSATLHYTLRLKPYDDGKRNRTKMITFTIKRRRPWSFEIINKWLQHQLNLLFINLKIGETVNSLALSLTTLYLMQRNLCHNLA
jgi:hypothetical protein